MSRPRTTLGVLAMTLALAGAACSSPPPESAPATGIGSHRPEEAAPALPGASGSAGIAGPARPGPSRPAGDGTAPLPEARPGGPGTTGSPSPRPVPAPTAAPVPVPTPVPGVVAQAYQFPGGMIEGAQGGGAIYTRVEGLIAVPSAPGPHPTVVVIHGSYPSCLDLPRELIFTREVLTTPWVEGCGAERLSSDRGINSGPDYLRTPASWAYLAETLARRGFAVVIPDVNAKESQTWGGEPDPLVLQTNLAKLHLGIAQRLSGGDRLGLPPGKGLAGKVDASRVYVVGHSSGGGFAVAAALRRTIPGLRAIVGIEPNVQTEGRAVSALVPSLLIAGECDEQIAAEEVVAAGRELGTANPAAMVITATVPHATHIGMVYGGGDHTVGPVRPSSAPSCAKGALLPKPVQRAQAAELTAAFLEQIEAGTRRVALPALPGVALTATANTRGTTVSVVPGRPGAPQRAPRSVTYQVSRRALLPQKPASLVLHTRGRT